MKKILLFMAVALLVFGMVSCDQEVKAKMYKLTYNANGAVGNVPASIEVEEGGTIIVSSYGSLSMRGYDFVEWNTKKDGSGKAYRESQFLKVDRDITLYAQWSLHVYSISYDLDGGSYPEDRSNPNDYTIETETFTLNNPERVGYEFLGWMTSGNEKPNKNVSIPKGTTGELSFTAEWRPLNSYSISYDVNGGEGSIEIARKSEGESVEITSDSGISRKGYEFVCWNTEPDGTGKDYNPGYSYEEDADLQLYAKWSIVKYSIEYNLNDGKLTAGKSNPDEYTVETADIILENPTKYGYEFIGWKYKDDSDVLASTDFSIKKGTTGNLSIVAVWKLLDTYAISYDANGGTGTIETQHKYKGESLTISSGEGVERVGYMFSCWNTKSDGTGTDYNPNDVYSANADLRLYAKWDPIKYSITYELDGGAFSDGSVITEYTIETDTFTLPIPTKAEYEFVGWSAKGPSEAQKTVSIEKGSTGNLSFTAVWRELKRYTVSYDANGGFGSIESQSKLEGFPMTISDAVGIARTGYSFVCWNTKSDGTGTDYKPNDEYDNDENIVLYVKWSVVKYSITYDLAGGTLPEGKSNPSGYTIETETFTLVNPEKDGFRFMGWKKSGSKDETAEKTIFIANGSYGDVSFIAVWKQAEECTVTFDINGADGGFIPDSMIVYEGDSFIAPSSDSFYRDDYVFEEWNTKADGNGSRYSISETVEVCGDVTLYAIWKKSPLWYTYLSESDSYSVACKDKNTSSVVIPSTYKGKPITEIGYGAFKNCTALKEVLIPTSVTIIDWYAFSGCRGLTSITIPSSVTDTANYAFKDCENLSIVFAEGMEKIPSGALYGATGVVSVTIPSSVTSIGGFAFKGCSGLESVTIPSNVSFIGYYAFENCSGLTSITIPSNVTSIGEAAFRGCSGLESIEVGAGNSVFYSDGNCLIVRDTKELVLGCSNSVIPEDAKSIGDYAFYDCKGLTELTIPSNVKSMGESAFENCSGLTGSLVIPPGVTEIGNSAFKGCNGLTSITIPSSVTAIGDKAFAGCKNLSIVFAEGTEKIPVGALSGASGVVFVKIPLGVTFIGDSAFKGCSGLESVTIPSSVMTIGSEVFSGCNGLSIVFAEGTEKIPVGALSGASGVVSVKIPLGVTFIGGSAFKGCSGLKSVTIPSSVTGIGNEVFYNCKGLTELTIPSSVKIIYHDAFSGCSGLTSVTISEGVETIGDGVFYNCEGLTELTIPSSVKSVGSYAFRYCSGLTNVTISKGITSIGEYAFYGCSELKSVMIPSSVTSVGNYAFSGCSGLTELTISEGVETMGIEAFNGCSSLSKIAIPSSVTSIGAFAFRGCNGVELIEVSSGNTEFSDEGNCLIKLSSKTLLLGCNNSVIPEDVTSIGTYAFENCSGLTELTIPPSVKSIWGYAFYGCSGLTNITIPSSVTDMARHAFSGCKNLSIVFAEGMEKIPSNALSGASGVVSVMIPFSVTTIGSSAFSGCSKLNDIFYSGTGDQWNSITKYSYWNYNTGKYTIHCTDGDIAKN